MRSGPCVSPAQTRFPTEGQASFIHRLTLDGDSGELVRDLGAIGELDTVESRLSTLDRIALDPGNPVPVTVEHELQEGGDTIIQQSLTY